MKPNPNTFCPAPFMELHVSVGGSITPCCIYDESKELGNIEVNSIQEVFNGDKINKIREELISGVKHQGCSICWKNEEITGDSYRCTHLDTWKEAGELGYEQYQTNGYIPIESIKKLDLRFDNKCNLKCRICGPRFSTSLVKEAEELRDQFLIHSTQPAHSDAFHTIVTEENFNELLNISSNVEELYFAGGEPLLQDKHYEILQFLIDSKVSSNIRLQYNTNFTKLEYKGKSVLKMWREFKHVTCGASLDDSHKRGEYQRKGTTWVNIVKNRQKLIKEKNLTFHLSPTVSLFNVISLPLFIEEWIDLGYLNVTKNAGLHLNILDFPFEYNIKNLPQHYKNKINIIYTSFTSKYSNDNKYTHILPELEKVVKVINSSREVDISTWYVALTKKLNALDNLRKESFLEVYPEYKLLSWAVEVELDI